MDQQKSLNFADAAQLLKPYWLIERIEGEPFTFAIEPYPQLGPDVYLTRQSGFVVKSLPDPVATALAVCKVISGEISVNIAGRRYNHSPGQCETYLASNRYPQGESIEVVHKDLEILFFNVGTQNQEFDADQLVIFSSIMTERFDLSFEDIYDAVNVFQGFGPLRPLKRGASFISSDMDTLCLMLKNFAGNRFDLKAFAHDLGVSIATASRMQISGRSFKEWSDAYKISQWIRLRETKSKSEISDILGYSSFEKLQNFLVRQGAMVESG